METIAMGQAAKYYVGRILMDSGFLNQHHLDSALEEQKHTEELLGQVLIRKGVLQSEDITVPLIIQKHLGSLESAVKLAAGERQLLGALLVQSGHITSDQLDQVIAEQQRSGEKLGEVLKRLGMLTDQQLSALLNFQSNQDAGHVSPLRLGELLVSTGKITREHLEDALRKQKHSDKNLGEILIESGYAHPGCIEHGARLQKMLLKSVLAAILTLGVGGESYAGGMCLLSEQLQNPAMKAQYAAKVAAEVGNMVAYNTHTDGQVVSDAANDITTPAFSFGRAGSSSNSGIDALSRDCLSCHDGIVTDAVAVNYRNTPGHRTNRYDGKAEHPIGMDYAAYSAMDSHNYKPAPAFNSKMIFVDGKVGCLTCHNPLNPEKSHLVMSDYRSALCLTCHTK
jgi:predicted CXXCH cytochrome family protein